MARFSSFQDIEAWRKARVLAGEVYSVTKVGSFSRDFALRDQVRRAAISVMANIAEGFGRRTNKDFANFLYTAKGSTMETMSHFFVAKDQGYIDEEGLKVLVGGYDEIRRMLIALIRYLENNPKTNQLGTRN